MENGIVVSDLSSDLRKLKMQRLMHVLGLPAGMFLNALAAIGLAGAIALLLWPQASEWLESLIWWLAS